MERKNKESGLILREKLQKLEKDYFLTKEKLKMYGAKDCSENSDWLLLNENLLICQTQIEWLKAKIATASQEEDRVITYRLLATGEEKTIQLTDGETEPNQGQISRSSPLGMALNDKKVGAIVEVKTKHKKYQIKILVIK